jgi:U3 small nucleolar RNA-associated protein 3
MREQVDSDNEEAAQLEEEEAVRLQREAAAALQPEDFSDDDVAEQEEATLGEAVFQGRRGDGGGKGATRNQMVEHVERDLAALKAHKGAAALIADAPELQALLGELTKCLTEVKQRVQPLLAMVQRGEFATQKGVSYLEAKHLLLLSYCMHIVFYLLLKAEGKPVKDHPVVLRLVELRLYLEKIRPIDKKMAYQIDKLLVAATKAQTDPQAEEQAAATAAARASGAGAAAGRDALSFKPNPAALVGRSGGDAAAGGGGGVYRAPRIAPAAMGGVGLDEDMEGAGVNSTCPTGPSHPLTLSSLGSLALLPAARASAFPDTDTACGVRRQRAETGLAAWPCRARGTQGSHGVQACGAL